ncbi:1-(5-phosphoribosyl)-5-amino-4-imidazole-carboxylate carboxylase [Mycobacterium sp. E796]|nr:nickel pincer cofactor biosynthesis protein LarB [Mycobacterium sp. E796]OBI51997.1 1-(5-phosphoribosyl)-5-amino-4-imidazole-carboxylate carboxylase [Mycobacterium sp. E796]
MADSSSAPGCDKSVHLGYATVDVDRAARTGDPEVVYAAGKTPEETLGIVAALRAAHPDRATLVTRAGPEHITELTAQWPEATVSKSSVAVGPLPQPRGTVAVVSAGTSDAHVAAEAALTVRVFGSEAVCISDVGVAGLHRILAVQPRLQAADVAIVIAGMEGALPSVVGGLVGTPIIAVPTSVGYGTGAGGVAALLGMLNSCAPGIVVCNIDNGFGAGVFAARIARRVRSA